jgi:glutamine---fructose-6-phosphate transaminase (isomerizing)
VSLRDEILEQPEAARRQLAASPEALAALAGRLSREPVDSIVIAARGTSDHAAIYAQYVFGVRHRLPVALATPSVLTVYGIAPRFERSLVIGISQSGASPDVGSVVAAARSQGAPTLAITNDPASPLGRSAEYLVELAAGPERAVAATKTYTTSLLAIARLSVVLGNGAPAELATVPAALEAALAGEAELAVESLAQDLAGEEREVVLARGFEYATARESALKLKELARVFADPYSAADFEHGPLALVEPGIPILAIAPGGLALGRFSPLLRRLRASGANLAVVSDEPSVLALARHAIPLPGGVPEWLRPIVSIVPLQLYAMHLARARGLDPERPVNIRKVTLTR